ncbi:MAG: tail fiber domain-containing protein [Saprospiraceae bacterium]|nr:tail fiber domain-containing protein [Pyrinomonadaceae bacterium]
MKITINLIILIFCIAFTGAAFGQTAEFTYQGRFTDTAQQQPTNGTYQIRFALFDAVSGGSQIGPAIVNPSVLVTNGIFTVSLNFGASSFSGATRFLQISVFTIPADTYVGLTPRQPVTSAPYAIKALDSDTAAAAEDAANLGGVPATQYVQTNDSRLNDDRNPTAGSGNYVQNRLTPQTSTNFNIDGNGTAGGTLTGDLINSNSQYNIGNARVLGVAGQNNTFAGFGSGFVNTGVNNSFFGRSAGFDNLTGGQNAFFGSFAGANNTTGSENSFAGSGSGDTNTTGSLNSFFGKAAGSANTTGSSNTFIGRESGLANTTGFFNTFIGRNAGSATTTGFQNTFFGANAGTANQTGDNNTYIGFNAGTNSVTGSNNTLIGYNANTFSASAISNSTAIGAGATVTSSDTIVLGTDSTRVVIPGTVHELRITNFLQTDRLYIDTLPGGGGTDICIRTSDRVISQCSSSIRYKDNIASFNPGLSLISRLRPVTFDWKSDGSNDLGLVAEEVAAVEPLLATYKDGQVEGVKYDRVGVVLLNAVKEQQTQIEYLNQQIVILKWLICTGSGSSGPCK